jgi:hypothetical protein
VTAFDRFSTAGLQWQQTVNDLLASMTPQQRTIVGLLAISDQTNQNPAKLLAQLGCELPGTMGTQLVDMANLLAEGNQLFKTIEQYPKLVPPQAVVLLGLAESEGTLKFVFSLVRNRFPCLHRPQEIGIGSGIRMLLKIFAAIGLITYLMIKVVPELKKILDEFNVESYLLRFGVGCINLMVDWISIPLLVLGVGLLIYAAVWFVIKVSNILFKGIRPWQPAVASKKITRKKFLASLAQFGGLHNVIERFSGSKSLNRLLPRLNAVRNRLRQGETAWSALASQQLVSRSNARLDTSASPETQAWLMRWEASCQQQKIERNRTIFSRGIWIVIQIAVVCAVLLACMIVLGTLIELLNQLT